MEKFSNEMQRNEASSAQNIVTFITLSANSASFLILPILYLHLTRGLAVVYLVRRNEDFSGK